MLPLFLACKYTQPCVCKYTSLLAKCFPRELSDNMHWLKLKSDDLTSRMDFDTAAQ
jgi:hypothetical protein